MSTALTAFAGEQAFGIRDLRLVERAAREQWPIPEALRAEVISRIGAIVTDASKSTREITAAARALLGFSKLNLQSVAQMLKAGDHEALGLRAAAAGPVQSHAPIGDQPSVIGALSDEDSAASETPDATGRELIKVPIERQDLAPIGDRSSAMDHLSSDVVAPSSAISQPSSAICPLPAPMSPPTAAPTRRTRNPRATASPHAPAKRSQETVPDGLAYVTHLELFAEDPTPDAPAIERVGKARMRFRVGKGVNVWVAPDTFHAQLPPGPEPDLLLNNRMQICRVDDPSRYEPD